ncbi:hypothetical protein BGZ61DRAFT_453790 [Ilyonectria robusta]|uniref:uncharacterized protein n=1 Tax=Ilyonectria robusta TaxID=1079257 RepID=UPI001E8CB36B|nr:uncharacterized protein BGZ61DRAFT_453790 [Ilyonectria robusta]KAH8686874.1 hypothetical protein BGZ61DRAFT_453790 [Ilyonectria robusta]
MLDSRPSPRSPRSPGSPGSSGQGLNQLQLRLDCRPRFTGTGSRSAAASSTLSATRSAAPGPATSRSFALDSPLHIAETETLSPPGSPSSPSAPQLLQSPPVSPRRRDSGLHVDAGSPKHRSPLRNAISYSDAPQGLDHYFTAPTTGPRVCQNQFGSVDMAYTGDKRTPALRPVDPTMAASPSQPSDSSPLSRWFTRGSTPVPDSQSASSVTSTPSRTRSASSTPKMGSPAGSSRFAFFTSPASNSPVPVPQNDELMNIDIQSALFPGGPPIDGSAFSPAAFKNLQMNAIGLLGKFQSAYQQRTIDYQELKSERDAQDEEKEEVEIRVQHLKMQLEEMARKAAEREETMASLLQELAQEKRSRAEEQQAARYKCVSSSEASIVSEDLSIDEDRQKRNWRKSTATSKSDLSLDTDEDSMDEASIFSRSRSPTNATSMSEISPSATPTQQKPAMLEPPRHSRTSNPQMTTFQKLFKGYANEAHKDGDSAIGADGCRNCQGQDASVAWDTVSLLKDENKGLKTRVQELETAVEGALDVINGLAL